MLNNFVTLLVTIVLTFLVQPEHTKIVEAKINLRNNDCNHLLNYMYAPISSSCKYNRDVLSEPEKLATRHGYLIERHSVITQDGYIITLFRIQSKNPNVKLKHQKVFLHHGVATNSAIWVDLGKNSLAFVLADKGYDVWLGNARGTTYSNKHTSLTVNDRKYWDFNLDNLAKYDLPEELKYVARHEANETKKIIYIGHSMGTTLPLMYISENNAEASRLLQGMIALAPVIYFSNKVTTLTVLVFNPLIKVVSFFGITGVFYHEKLQRLSINTLCQIAPVLCYKLIEFSAGKLTKEVLPNSLLVIVSYTPAGTAIDVLKHYFQFAISGKLAKYNYGTDLNMKIYGQSEPLPYNLTKITLPVYLLYGKNDIYATEAVTQRVFNELGSKVKHMNHIPLDDNLPGFGHLTFLYAANIATLLYEPIFQAIDDMNSIS